MLHLEKPKSLWHLDVSQLNSCVPMGSVFIREDNTGYFKLKTPPKKEVTLINKWNYKLHLAFRMFIPAPLKKLLLPCGTPDLPHLLGRRNLAFLDSNWSWLI